MSGRASGHEAFGLIMVPSISVALCTRNGSRHVREQLESILAGDLLPDEIIVYDDASTDGTVDIVLEVDSRGVDVRLHRNESPLGVAANFESAIRACRGDIIVLCDQDDRWAEHRLRVAVDVLMPPDGAILVHSDAALIDDEGARIGATLFRYLSVTPSELRSESVGNAFDVLLRRNIVTGATVAFRRELRDTALPIAPGWVHDEWLALVASCAGRIGLTAPAVEYRLHGANQIGADRPTLGYRLGRAIRRNDERNVLLAARWRGAAERLRELLPPDRAVLVERKARFEARRAALPSARILRIPRIAREAIAGNYSRFASQRRLDVLRDLLQPRRAPTR